MKERDAPPVSTAPRPLVDQANTHGTQPIEFLLKILDPEGDMVHRVTTLGKKPRDRSFWIGWLNKLDIAVASSIGNSHDALLGHLEPLPVREAEPLIRLDCFIEITNDDTHVMERNRKRDLLGCRLLHLDLDLAGRRSGFVIFSFLVVRPSR
jgi:hypothetical protein